MLIYYNFYLSSLYFYDIQWLDTKKPLFTSFQEEQKIIPLPANCPTVAVMDVAENIRAKIYAVLGKLGKKSNSKVPLFLCWVLWIDFTLESIFQTWWKKAPLYRQMHIPLLSQCTSCPLELWIWGKASVFFKLPRQFQSTVRIKDS